MTSFFFNVPVSIEVHWLLFVSFLLFLLFLLSNFIFACVSTKESRQIKYLNLLTPIKTFPVIYFLLAFAAVFHMFTFLFIINYISTRKNVQLLGSYFKPLPPLKTKNNLKIKVHSLSTESNIQFLFFKV